MKKSSTNSKHSSKDKKKPAKEVPQPQTWEEYMEGKASMQNADCGPSSYQEFHN